MSLDLDDFIARIAIPVFEDVSTVDHGILTPQAVALVVGTIWHESGAGTSINANPQFLYQRPNGPALGLPQFEMPSLNDLFGRWLQAPPQAALLEAVRKHMTALPIKRQIISNLDFACLMVRLKYYPNPMPIPTDAFGLAMYYKHIYNSSLGAAQVNTDLLNTFKLALSRVRDYYSRSGT